MKLFFKNNKKLVIILLSFIGLLLLVFAAFKITYGFNGLPATKAAVYPDECQWLNQKFGFNNYDYNVTNIAEFSNNIGKQIGKINYNGTNIIPSTQYTIYSIKSYPNEESIAIKTKYGYLLATRGKKQSSGTGIVIEK